MGVTIVLPSALQQDRDITVSERVLAALATREKIDPLNIDRPLYDAIDPDALDTLFQSDEMKGRVRFTYLGYEVAVHSDGEIKLTPTDG